MISRYRLARCREYYTCCSEFKFTREAALEDARERYGAASQSEREERLSRRRERYGAASQSEAEDRLSRRNERDRMRRQNETDEQREAR